MTAGIERKIKRGVLLASYTTIKLGGPTDFFVECETVQEIRSALEFARGKKLKVHVLGGGSNSIFYDSGFKGMVVIPAVKGMSFGEEITVGAGEGWDDLVAECVKRGIRGFECMSGIPGTVGASPVQNVGAYGQDVSGVVLMVKAIDRQSRERKQFSREQCHFGYRSSRFKDEDKDRYIIYEVIFKEAGSGLHKIIYPEVLEELGRARLKPDMSDDKAVMMKVRAAVLEVRKRKAMVVDKRDEKTRSCGSYFVNPKVSRELFNEIEQKCGEAVPKVPTSEKQIIIPAAWLLEKAGYKKGFRYKGIGVSTKHNLALINISGSTKELLALEAKIKRDVKDKFGVDLVREPVLVE